MIRLIRPQEPPGKMCASVCGDGAFFSRFLQILFSCNCHGGGGGGGDGGGISSTILENHSVLSGLTLSLLR